MRFSLVCALAGLVLTACGYSPLESTLDPVPEGELTFLVEDGLYDAHFVTVSNTCSDVNADVRYSTLVTSGVDGTPTFVLTGPSSLYGWSERSSSIAETRYVHHNPTVVRSTREYPDVVAVESEVWIERAGPGWLELRYETLHETCEHIGRLTLTLRD